MPLLTSIVNWINLKRVYQIDLTRKYPAEVQNETFFNLITRTRDTEWGKKHDFTSIDSIERFSQQVPLNEYESLKPYIDRLREGEKDILWPGEIKWFAKSSGTTSDKSKFIPVSAEALEECHYRGGKDIIAIYLHNNPESEILSGKGLTLGGSHQINNYNNQSYYGDLSAILIENLPFWVDLIRTPSAEIVLIEKWEEKLEKLTEATLKENVTSLSGVPSWNLVMLKHILEVTGKSNALEVWPNIELFIHGGVSFTPYREQFQKIFPSPAMHYMETYNASEGFFAIQDDPTDPAMLLMLDLGVFYEFIPMNSFRGTDSKAIPLSKVEKGVNYAMVISTNGGLWRYIIGDTVMFTSLSPHKIVITGRTRHFINVFGEEVIIDNAEKALRIACEKTGALIRDYTAAPVFMTDKTKGSHQWLIEFEKYPADLDYFRSLLDHALMSLNSDYEAKRYNNITLDQPGLVAVAQGTFYQWLQGKGKLGGQNKVPRLSNSRQYADELLAIHQQLASHV